MRQVEIRVKGHLDEAWGEWLEGFAFTHNEDEETILRGEVADQAALYGLVAKLRDLGATLISIQTWEEEMDSAE